MGRVRRSWVLAAILVLFVALSILYNVYTPVFESPDELQHTAFVAWLDDHGALPVVTKDKPGPWEQEGTQPPLYYWLATALTGWQPHDAADRLANVNPHAGGIGDPKRPDNKNRVIHDPAQESWPYHGTVLFVHLLRLVSTLIAVGTLLAVYRLGRTVFPDRPGIALGMVGLVAFIPQFLFLSASVNNDNLVILICSWTVVLLASWLCTARLPSWLALGALGLLLGLAALSKLSGLFLWPLAAATLAWLAWRPPRPGPGPRPVRVVVRPQPAPVRRPVRHQCPLVDHGVAPGVAHHPQRHHLRVPGLSLLLLGPIRLVQRPGARPDLLDH
jgi:hypothetical protein